MGGAVDLGAGFSLNCLERSAPTTQANKDSSMTSNDELLYYTVLYVGAGQPGEGLGPPTQLVQSENRMFYYNEYKQRERRVCVGAIGQRVRILW